MTPSTTLRTSDTNTVNSALDAAIARHIANIGSNTLVTVKAVHPGDGIVGKVDVQPMVHQRTTDGTAIPHDTIYGIPYMRIHGGECAVVIDPAVGDIGYIIVSGRDQSEAVEQRKPASPPTLRSHSLSDSVYVGGFLGKDPKHYLQITQNGVRLVTTGTVEIQAQSASIQCDLTVQGDIKASGDVKAGGISLKQHKHPGVQSGNSDTQEPE
ncbi:Gp138 family membrane-puncturing spike protein [Swingsia samuiensis]|uniref:Baseplate assembly protein n=1 Tax=Swingsia samuiensis TaxID=1293412 RepID=A0A4Y6UM33_9PROT|nr:Gp138 family membrane-puncturing spike protein [Swingsia samuiensis]QDH17397.1 baseplate assembly protein [Swingsia samuiensis]